MAPKLVLILCAIAPLHLVDDLQKRLGPGYRVKYVAERDEGSKMDGGEKLLPEDLKEAEGVLMYQFPEGIKSREDMPKLKFIQLASAGYNHLTSTPFWQSLPEKDSPVTISSASGIHVVPIAEHVIMTTMAAWHFLPAYVLSQAKPAWERDGYRTTQVRELRGHTMGILGYGHIGRECARMAQVLGMKVVAATRSGKKAAIGGYLCEGTGDHDGDIPSGWYSTEDDKSIAEFYSKSDVMVNTLPSLPGTKKFVSKQAFRAMPTNAICVNIGRGDTVDQEALIRALSPDSPQEERIGMASLDVTDPEPLGTDSPLWKMKNVLITPHVSGASNQYWHRATDLFGVNLQRMLEQDKGALNAVLGRSENA